MKKILLTILFSQILFVSSAQFKKYPSLVKEDINVVELYDKYSKDPISENYVFYKIATTIPITYKSEIEEQYILRDYNLDKLFPNKSEEAIELSKVLFDTLKMRAPLPGEAQNFIYFEAKMDKSAPPLLNGTISGELRQESANVLMSGPFVNLFDMSFVVTSNLRNANKALIKLGNKCIVTTTFDVETNMSNILIAIELRDAFQKVIDSGNISIGATLIKTAEYKITKENIGERNKALGLPFYVLEFDKGVVHLMSNNKSYGSYFLSRVKLIGDIGNNKFRIQAAPTSMMTAVYSKYRNDAKKDFDEFIKEDKIKRSNLDLRELNTSVYIYHIGYDVDTLHIIDAKSAVPAKFKYNVAVSKNGADYSFRTIAVTKRVVAPSAEMIKFQKDLRAYVCSNVRFPAEPQRLGIHGDVVFTFEITPSGEIVNVNFISSPHEAFNDEVLYTLKKAPKLKRVDYGKEDYNLLSTMRVVFSL